MSGICGVLLVAQINAALSAATESRAAIGWIFAALALLAMLSRTLGAMLFERLGQHSLAELRRYIASHVLATDYRRLEVIGSARVQSALSEHCSHVAQFFVSLPAILTNAVVVVGCLCYMALLSWQIFCIALLVMALGSLGYHFAHLLAIKHLRRSSGEQDRLFGHFRALTDGAKELRLHQGKRQHFAARVLDASINEVKRSRVVGMSIFVASSSWGNFLSYAFIGVVLFVLVGDAAEDSSVMIGFTLILLYMMTPLEMLLVNIPRANLARVAADRIDDITAQMTSGQPQVAGSPLACQAFEVLSLSGVSHSYYHEQSDEIFTLGPLDLEFRPGTITFLVGGNGSGKTTLAKLLVGLYWSESGEIRVDGKHITRAGLDAYRQLFSAVFSDFHLFESLMDTQHPQLDAVGNRLITRLQLQHKVAIRDGKFTTQALSQGQRKRLALIAACLEDRPFLVFDEWAADQDPTFKEVFYRELLPELKAQGKAIFVITHDDRYFSCCDRLLRLEQGCLLDSPILGPWQDSAGQPMAHSVAT